MGELRRTGSAVALVGLLLVAGLAPTVAAQATVDVTIDGTAVQDGETLTVTDDPLVDVDLEANESIQSVSIRVDGETRRTFEPASTSFSERVTLDVDDGEHEVSIVADSVDVRLTVTVIKDSNAPLITYTSPFQSQGYPANGEVTIDRGETELAADLSDQSSIREVRIERVYEWTFAGGGDQDRKTYRIENPGENVSQPILFGLGENDLQVEVIDEHGQRRTHDMTVRVTDVRKPSIDIDRFERSGNGELTVAGTVDDEVKVNSLSYRFEGTSQEYFVLNPTSKEPTRERVSADFEFTATPPDDAEGITLVATDVAGNTRRWEVPFDYRDHLVPTITFDDATGVAGDEIAVEGHVADGRVTRVVVEAIGPDGTTIDTVTVYDGTATERVAVRARVGSAPGETTVVIRAVDAAGGDHRQSLTLDTPATTTAAPSPIQPRTPAPTDTVTAVTTPSTTTTAAAADVTDEPRQHDVAAGREGPSLPLLGLGLLGLFVGLAIVVGGVRRIDWSGISLPTASTTGRSERRPSGVDHEDETGERGGTETETTAEPDATESEDASDTPFPTDGVGGYVGRHSVADLNTDDVEAIVEQLDADGVADLVDRLDASDTETVVLAIRLLRETAVKRPDLAADSDAKSRLRDLRLSSDPRVAQEATGAVKQFDDADIY
jgi:hypothetical protein